jgi:hypothetical protein
MSVFYVLFTSFQPDQGVLFKWIDDLDQIFKQSIFEVANRNVVFGEIDEFLYGSHLRKTAITWNLR